MVAQFVPVVLASADARNDAYLVVAGVGGEFLGTFHQSAAVALMLVLVGFAFVPDCDLRTVDVEFADQRRVLELRANRIVREPKPTEADEEVLLEVLERDEVFGAATGVVGHHVEFDVVRVLVVHPGLATADTLTLPAVLIHALAGQLSQVRFPDAGVNEVRRNVSLDALEARIA